MRVDDGRKLDHKTLEEMRVRAVRQIIERNERPEDVADAYGLARSTVYGWVAKFHRGGWVALEAKPIPGRPGKLTQRQMNRLVKLVTERDPRQLRFGFALWTRTMIGELILREFGVSLSVGAVGRLLRRLGLSPQRPLYRAYQQDPEAVARWKREEYPAIAAAAKKAGGVIYFADEASARSDHHAGTTWAKRGHTPVVAATGARFSVNMVSAVSAQGALRFMLVDGTMTATKFISFCKRLLHDAAKPVFLIVDGHPTHRSKAVKAFVEGTADKLRLFFLPGYSPQLNPDEWVWKNVKNDRLAKAGATTKHELRQLAISALRRLQRVPALIRGFFNDPELRYVHAATA